MWRNHTQSATQKHSKRSALVKACTRTLVNPKQYYKRLKHFSSSHNMTANLNPELRALYRLHAVRVCSQDGPRKNTLSSPSGPRNWRKTGKKLVLRLQNIDFWLLCTDATSILGFHPSPLFSFSASCRTGDVQCVHLLFQIMFLHVGVRDYRGSALGEGEYLMWSRTI